MRYVISGTRRAPTFEGDRYPAGTVVYVSKSGAATYHADRAAVIRSIEEARKERDYWNLAVPRWEWRIEQLPPRVAVANAVLRAVEVS